MLRETMTSTMPVAMIAIPAACTASVVMLPGAISLPPLIVEDEQDHREGDQHPEQAEVDLRLGEHSAHRRTGGGST